MTRGLRLAMLLAALAVSGPMPPARAVDAARRDVSIAWFQNEESFSPKRQHSNTEILPVAAERDGFNPSPAPVLSATLLTHSLYQRPPPFQN